MQWIYIIYGFRFLKWVTKNIDLFHDIQIFWDVTVQSTHTLPFTSWWSVRCFNVFLIVFLWSPRLHSFIKISVKAVNWEILFQFKISLIFCKKSFISVMTKLNFQQLFVSSTTWSFRNHSDVLIWCSRIKSMIYLFIYFYNSYYHQF